jgi:hypothetical protein
MSAPAPQANNVPDNVLVAPHATVPMTSNRIPTIQEVLDSHKDRPSRTVVKWDQARRDQVMERVARSRLRSMTVQQLRDPGFIRPLVIEVNSLDQFQKERAITLDQLLNFLTSQKDIADAAAAFEESWVHHVKAYATSSKRSGNNVYQRMHAANVSAGKITD